MISSNDFRPGVTVEIIEVDDVLRIDTRTGQYIERA